MTQVLGTKSEYGPQSVRMTKAAAIMATTKILIEDSNLDSGYLTEVARNVVTALGWK